MVLKTGLIKNTTHGGPKTSDHKLGNILSLALRFLQSVTVILPVEVLALNSVNLIIKPGFPCSVCFFLAAGWLLCLTNTYFWLRRRWHKLLCLEVDVCDSSDHGWDCWAPYCFSVDGDLPVPLHMLLCVWLFTFTLWRAMTSACRSASTL